MRRAPAISSGGARKAPLAALLALAAALALSACGSSARSPSGSASAASPGGAAGASVPGSGCAASVARTLGEVATHIYNEASGGGDVEQAVQRVRGSEALKRAIAGGEQSGARAALKALLVNQIVRIEIVRGGRPFATAGSAAAIAPVRGSIPGSDASFVLSTQAARSYLQVVSQVTGAQLVLYTRSGRFAGTIPGPPLASVRRDRRLSYAGHNYQVAAAAAGAYPSGALRVALLVPSRAIACPASISQVPVETLGHVGERIYEEELHSPDVLATLHHIEADTALQRAVGERNVAATRAAIVGLFAAHIHVVRVRVRVNVAGPGGAQRFFYDLGGPFVLAPVHGALRSAGKLVGHFSFAIQDDAGYLKLAHLFTGAEVLMRRGSAQVMGTLQPGPPGVPDRGRLSYGGRSYQAYSFTGEAFPSGPLRISLLIASPRAGEQ